MNPDVIKLLDDTRRKLTVDDIRDWSSVDPVSDSDIILWNQIRETGQVPRHAEFVLSEVIGLTGWQDPLALRAGERFLAFRRFSSAVAVSLLHQSNCSDDVRCLNYLARDLIIDIDDQDPAHFDLVRNVFPPTRSLLVASNCEEEYPFFTLGILILAQRTKDWQAAEDAAAQLINDEVNVCQNESLNWAVQDQRFLLGLTNNNLLNADWIQLTRQIQNPGNDPNIAFLMEQMTW